MDLSRSVPPASTALSAVNNAAASFSVLIWAFAEGFGGPYGSGSADIGAAIIYAVVFMALLALSAYTGPARYSVDYYLEKRISWWWKVAEVRRPRERDAELVEVEADVGSDHAAAIVGVGSDQTGSQIR